MPRHTEKMAGKKVPRRATGAVRPEEEAVRLNKFLADSGVASRRKADELIAAGRVRINGNVVKKLGTQVHPAHDDVTVNGTPVYLDHQLIYILLNKPKDCLTTTSDEKGRTTVMDLVPANHRVFPVGRLDRNTTGLLLLTNDGDLAYRLTHPKFHTPKVYRAELKHPVKHNDVDKLRKGVKILGEKTAPCEMEILDSPKNFHVGLILHEGKNRQVRRMFETVGNDVKKLERVGYADLDIGDLKRGHWRYLDEYEIRKIKKFAASRKIY